jgi:hypothetical protein
MGFAYPGVGRQLYVATYASGQPSQVTYPLDASIEDTKLSDSEAINDAFNTTITINFGSAPGSTTTIQYDSEPTFTNPITLDTVPAGADLVALWTTQERLPGFLRISNTSGATIASAFIQKQVASVG